MTHRPLLASPAAADSSLVARDLGRRHPDSTKWLYQQIELEVQPGDRLAMVGPTGSGKSLILRALALLDPVDRGEIAWRGQPVRDASVPEFRGQVLYLQQRSPVIEGTVEDNLKIPFSLRLRQDRSFPQDLVDEFLQGLGRDPEFLASRTTTLSGGERQLVAILRALLAAPSILLLDEPSAALDPEATAALETIVATWHSGAPTQRAYVWVSHDPLQARRVADRIVGLENGRMVDAS